MSQLNIILKDLLHSQVNFLFLFIYFFFKNQETWAPLPLPLFQGGGGGRCGRGRRNGAGRASAVPLLSAPQHPDGEGGELGAARKTLKVICNNFIGNQSGRTETAAPRWSGGQKRGEGETKSRY